MGDHLWIVCVVCGKEYAQAVTIRLGKIYMSMRKSGYYWIKISNWAEPGIRYWDDERPGWRDERGNVISIKAEENVGVEVLEGPLEAPKLKRKTGWYLVKLEGEYYARRYNSKTDKWTKYIGDGCVVYCATGQDFYGNNLTEIAQLPMPTSATGALEP